jgi:hypothetical protein
MPLIAFGLEDGDILFAEPDKRIFSFINDLSNISGYMESYVSMRDKDNHVIKAIININMSRMSNTFMYKFTTFSTLGLLYCPGPGSRYFPSKEAPKNSKDVLGIDNKKIEALQQYLNTNGMYSSERWSIIKSPKDEILGSIKEITIYSTPDKIEENSKIITFIIKHLYGAKITDCIAGPRSETDEPRLIKFKE